MSSRLQRILLAAALLTVLGARGVFAALPETLPAGMGKYIMALWPAGTPVPGEPSRRIPAVPEPDVAKLGGKVLDTMGHRRVIVLPLAAAEQLARHDAVAYLQRVWMGEALDGWSASESSADELLKADSNDGPTATWGPATYAYDGDGNIRSITRPTAADTYVYDDVGRLVQATVKGQTETYKYDAFGNLTEKGLASKPAMAFGVDAGSNRLIGHEYDAAGNILTRSEKSRYEYDSLNMAVYTPGAQGQEGRRILYDASDERLGTVMMGTTWRWTIRDFQGQVLREYFSTNPFQTWEWQQDHIRGEGHLIAGEGIRWKYNPSTNHWGGGRRHYHLDHLGSVRMVSDEGGRSIAEHDYYPFGATQTAIWQEQLIPGNQNNDGMRFAGHWRDYLGYVDAESPDYLDSMHARYYDPQMGRFLSVDPVLDVKRHLREPQGWNRYSYVMNNPVKSIDPDGRETFVVIVAPAGVDNPKGFAGHVGLFVTSRDGRQAGVSYGGAHDFKRAGMLGFINDYNAEGRSVTVYKLKTTPAQDAKMVDFLKQNPDGGVNPDAGRAARAMVTENCTTAACNTLNAGGVMGKNEDPNGAMSGAHAPNELKKALEPGGDLSNRVQQKWVFEPEKKEEQQ